MEILSQTDSSSNKVPISFLEITERLKKLAFEEYDYVIAIGSGGIMPGSLIAFHLNLPLLILKINYRDDNNHPLYDHPQLLENPDFQWMSTKKILLVDDVSVTGNTFKKGISMLSGHDITTLALKGKADITIFPEVKTCVKWPWK